MNDGLAALIFVVQIDEGGQDAPVRLVEEIEMGMILLAGPIAQDVQRLALARHRSRSARPIAG